MERIVNLHIEKLSEDFCPAIGENELICRETWRFRDNDRIFVRGQGSAENCAGHCLRSWAMDWSGTFFDRVRMFNEF